MEAESNKEAGAWPPMCDVSQESPLQRWSNSYLGTLARRARENRIHMAQKKRVQKKSTRKQSSAKRTTTQSKTTSRRNRSQAPDGYSFMKGRNGDWFVRAINTEMQSGDEIEVERKDGSTSLVRIRRIVWDGQFEDGTECIMATFRSLDNEEEE